MPKLNLLDNHDDLVKSFIEMNYPQRIDQLKEVKKELCKQNWFTQDWKSLIALWPNDDQPSCVMFQLFKKGWFNEDTCGIHIETWLTDRPLDQQQIPILMHVLHKKTFPGGHDADAVSKPLVNDPKVKALIKNWKGYKLGKGGMTPFRANKRFTEDNLVSGLIQEFSKTQEIGAYVDKYIENLSDQEKIQQKCV